MDQTTNRYASFITQKPYDDPWWDGKVTVCFSHATVGWVHLWISGTPYLQHITIFASDVFDPFIELVKWLEAIADNRLPAEFDIDEEGIGKKLSAFPVDDERVDFLVQDAYSDTNEIFLRLRVPKRQLVTEFVSKLDLFLQAYYEAEQWSGANLKALDLSTIRRFAQK